VEDRVNPDTTVILLAGGAGRRFGSGNHKLLVPVAGRPLLAYALETARSLPFVRRVVIPCHPDVQEVAERLALLAGGEGAGGAEIVLCGGGETRASSVEQALVHAGEGRLLIHDAARPLASGALFERVAAAIAPGIGVIPVVPAVDAVLMLRGEGAGAAYLPQGEPALVQTPQGFFAAEYRAAREAIGAQANALGDDGEVFLAAGYALRTVEGEPTNIKVTYAADLRIVRSLWSGADDG